MYSPTKPIAKLVHIIFNIVILLSAHLSKSHASAASNTVLSNETTSDFMKEETFGGSIPIVLSNFLHRMKKNGFDNIELMDLLFCGSVVILGMELLNQIVLKASGFLLRNNSTIPVRGKHLDDFNSKDTLFITFNKISTVPFIYTVAKYIYYEPNAPCSLSAISFKNTILPIPAFFIIYDFFYTILHWALHIQSVYAYIHKHHHRQKAPSRGNMDAVNVHPIEFFLGEYNHLFAMYIYTNLLGYEFHGLGFLLALVVGLALTSLNHSRFDSNIVIFGKTIYDSKWHDVHHRIPQSNYGQYINLWDLIFGTFRAYNSNDRVNPMAQLNPQTGKSFEHGKNLSKKD